MTSAIRLLRLAGAAGAAAGLLLCAPPVAAKPIGAYTTRGAWSFVSAPGLHPPRLRAQGRVDRRRLAPGDFLVASFPNLAATEPATGRGVDMVGQSGPLMLDNRLAPVWFHPVPTNVLAGDLQQETYDGRPVLVWWQGVITNTGATRSGEVMVVDERYRPVARLRARAPWTISLHDAVISGGDIWVTVYRTVAGRDLHAYGGPRRGIVYDAGVQEYELRTGRLLYTWDALAHVPLRDSEQPAPRSARIPWDAYHLNSVQVLGGGEVLVSLRNTWGIYLIDTTTGHTLWTLGGRASTFALARGARFSWQHDAELLTSPHGRFAEVSLFDDACCRLEPGGSFAAPSGPSRGLILKLDTRTRRVSVAGAYPHHPPLYVAFLGSMQPLPGGNVLVGWGSRPYFTEYSRTGQTLLEAVWPDPDQSYRALHTQSWTGTPAYPPSGAARRSPRGRATVYASWNGATQVAAWRVLGGASAGRLRPLVRRARTGFETAIGLGRRYALYEVQALDARGRVLASSRPFSAR